MLAKTLIDRHYRGLPSLANAIADALAQQVRHCEAEVVQIDACGHALMAEQPDQVLDSLFRFACASAK
jgi:pimeloyl-ACP methyl ester carboxylesterase